MKPRFRPYVGRNLGLTVIGDGKYKGHVKGDESAEVTVKVKDNRVTKFVANVYASCGYSNLIITVAYPPVGKKGATAKIKNGKFKVEGLCSADEQYSAKR